MPRFAIKRFRIDGIIIMLGALALAAITTVPTSDNIDVYGLIYSCCLLRSPHGLSAFANGRVGFVKSCQLCLGRTSLMAVLKHYRNAFAMSESNTLLRNRYRKDRSFRCGCRMCKKRENGENANNTSWDEKIIQ